MFRLLIPILLLLGACAPDPETGLTGRAPAIVLPPMKTFAVRPAPRASRPNAQIAQDFLDLSFQMESGRALPYLTKFDEPVRVAVVSGAPSSLERDLSLLITRIRKEAGIDIRRAQRGETAQIIVEAVPRAALQRAVPQAACFVVPNVEGWKDFKRYRLRGVTDWTKLQKRTKTTIIIPSDVSPQEVRDCLHEEIAQALGPLNDLYRLPDSTFNDDNFHAVLTGFDMLILRAYYSPEIKNGMTREQVARVLPRLLDRVNPRGRSSYKSVDFRTPDEWSHAISGALSSRTSITKRLKYANNAVKIARHQGWRDNRLAFSYFVQGRVALSANSPSAIASFLQAGSVYKSLYGDSVHTAHIATQMSAFALSAGQYESAIKIVNDALPAAQKSENAALLATLLMIKAEALDQTSRSREASIVRQDSLAWGRYGFGADDNVRARLYEISALTP